VYDAILFTVDLKTWPPGSLFPCGDDNGRCGNGGATIMSIVMKFVLTQRNS
jgi:hypothetical protein